MTSLADFTIVKALGQGVSGICRLVRRSADARLYALKELEMPSDQGEASAVLQEVHILMVLVMIIFPLKEQPVPQLCLYSRRSIVIS